MSHSVYGARSRRPVYVGKRRVPGLYERTLAGGNVAYEARIRLAGGTQRHVLLDATSKSEAVAELRALRVDDERGQAPQTRSLVVSVDEAAERWLDHLTTRTRHRDRAMRYSPRTVRLYRQRLDAHVLPTLGAKPIDTLTVADLRRLVDRLGTTLAPSTVTGIVSMLSALLRYAKRQGLVERNVVGDLDRDDRPGVARLTEPRYLSGDELDALLAQLGDVFRPAVATCTYAALRISEALGLRWGDVDFDRETIDVRRQLDDDGTVRNETKTPSSTATVPLLPALARELRSHRSRQAGRDLRRVRASELVFQTSRGKPQSRRNALRAVHRAGDKAGLNGDGVEPVGLHDLRHSFVALALDGRLTLPEVAVLARHANARVTGQLYAGVSEKTKGELAAKLLDVGIGT
jgi:integrase